MLHIISIFQARRDANFRILIFPAPYQTVLSELPTWITISYQPLVLQGVPLLNDFEPTSAKNPSPTARACLHLDPEPTISICLERSAVRAENDTRCLSLQIRVRPAWCNGILTAGTDLPKLQLLATNVCTNRQPLLAAVELAVRRTYLSTARREGLWRRLRQHLAGPAGSSSGLKPLPEQNFHLWDADLQLNR
ncbi:unnamed protein product [Dibothriocephalus latus]|uniref:Uncharacterized protein n=1 Tax=Dibothriocephalus latus TaxID=60516 RepID=A0A3P7LN72_DIBLA|nr:unnamed protein product [Dibothriocephalus latus]